MAFSGYSNLPGPASSRMAGAAYSIQRKLDLSFDFSVVNSGVDGHWISQPEVSRIYSGSITLYPFKQWEDRTVTGQITVASGWIVNEYWEGPILGFAGGFSKRNNLSEDFVLIPRLMLNYVPFMAQEYSKSVSLSNELGVLYGLSSGISLLVNPMLIFDFDENHSYAGLVLGLVI